MCLNYANFGCKVHGPVGITFRRASINNELKVIGTTTIGLLENVAVVDDNHLIANIISVAQFGQE